MEECPCNMEKNYKTAAISAKDMDSGVVKVKEVGTVEIPVSDETPTKRLRPFTFPTRHITILAESMQDAMKKLEEITKEDK